MLLNRIYTKMEVSPLLKEFFRHFKTSHSKNISKQIDMRLLIPRVLYVNKISQVHSKISIFENMISYKSLFSFNHFSRSIFQDSCRSACQLKIEVAKEGENRRIVEKSFGCELHQINLQLLSIARNCLFPSSSPYCLLNQSLQKGHEMTKCNVCLFCRCA